MFLNSCFNFWTCHSFIHWANNWSDFRSELRQVSSPRKAETRKVHFLSWILVSSECYSCCVFAANTFLWWLSRARLSLSLSLLFNWTPGLSQILMKPVCVAENVLYMNIIMCQVKRVTICTGDGSCLICSSVISYSVNTFLTGSKYWNFWSIQINISWLALPTSIETPPSSVINSTHSENRYRHWWWCTHSSLLNDQTPRGHMELNPDFIFYSYRQDTEQTYTDLKTVTLNRHVSKRQRHKLMCHM